MTWLDAATMLVKLYMAGIITAFVCGLIGLVIVVLFSE
jgi:hypothetical protein